MSLKTDSVHLTELPAIVLPQTSKQTAPYQSLDKGLIKSVRLFRYSYGFSRKSISKSDNRKNVVIVTHTSVR